MDIQQINNFLRPLLTISNGYGFGKGNGTGDGFGTGNGYGNGDGNGYGYGDGDGTGNGYDYGNGDGTGNGYGFGTGNGYGDGDGTGNGYGFGTGNGYGDGDGNGDGILLFNKQKVYKIDNIQSIITFIKNDVAKGFILQTDLTLVKCFIVRNDYHYSHGNTLKEALQSLEDKTLLSLPINERVKNFKKQFPKFNLKQKAQLLYNWHFKLTGSCKMGRDVFCKEHNIDLLKSKFTIYEFIKLTENSYNGHIIKQLLNI